MAFTLAVLAASLAAQASQPAATKPAEEPPWKVEDAHGPTRALAFETEEGTWIALDVHPDGKRIVFSLLGDLYLLPIEGGEARRITSGPAYDVQPRFRPDGSAIAFASDRGGIEGLWVCDLEGKDARPVSAEKESTVNTPVWSPDGDYLVGRKRITDTSSLATVELWMWHAKGGQGIRLTKKDDQPDAADPAFSPDGRFLTFSARDARFRYDRDVNEGIWQLKRLDRRTSQALPMTGEFGGAACPTLSPDGKTLAFVRRVRAKTVLTLMDLPSGRTWPLADDVERDNQEGFAFHGVFPGFAWTPDGKSIVATSGGRIARWDVVTGEKKAIPFRARVEQAVTDALRFPRRLGGERIRARILRTPVESPDGKRLVFSALGHLYGLDLPLGAPKRWTSAEDFEFSPAFSPDGKSLAFATWKDRAGGHVWVAPVLADGLGPPRQVTTVPGQYVNPSFSPDGKRLVFVKGSGATFRDRDPAEEIGFEIQWAGVEGGPARFVVGTKNRGTNRRMARPQFSADGERIFYLDDEEAAKPTEVPKAVLYSIRPDGTDRRAHLRWAKAEEATVSPDGRWVAFQEQHDAYATPLPSEVGKEPLDVGLSDSPLPLVRLSEEGAEWVAWADGGRTIAWIHGPTYRRLALEKALAAIPSARAEEGSKKGVPASEAVEIALEVPRAKPDGSVAYANARVVTMRGDEVIERGTILVEGDRIRWVGPAAEARVPAGTTSVDLAGRTVIPGLFDEHAHLHYSTLDVLPQRPWKYLANLAYGVTSTHDPSASSHEAFGLSEMVEAGLVVGPRIFSTGYVLYGAEDPARAVVKTLEDARHHLRRMKALGAFTVKSYMQPKREQRQMILAAAREEGMMVVPEGGGDLEMDATFVLDGHTTIEHALPVTPLRQDFLALLGRSGTAYTPTLLVAYGGLSGDRWFYQHHEVWKDARLQRFVPQGVIDPSARIRDVMATDEDWHHLDVAASAREVVRAGGRVCLGGHGQMQGLGPHWEIWAFVQGGMTPLEALRVATLSPAQALGLDADLGSIEAGKLADFVVLAKDPLERIENTDSVETVVKNGVAYAPAELERPR